MPILRYFWFMCAAIMVVNVIIWHRRLSEAAAVATFTAGEARRFTRGAAFWLVTPCVVLGLIALAAGWRDPLCSGPLSFRDAPSAATSVVILGLWMMLLGWIWLGQGATLLAHAGSALWTRPVRRVVSPGGVRAIITALVIASGVGTTIGSRQLSRPEDACALTQPAGSGAHMPALQLVFLGLFAATWLIGGNVLVAQHYRRMGESPWSGFAPFAFPFKDFNAREWLTLFILAALSLSFGAIALSLNSP